MRKDNKGFSLLEMIIVLGIAAILAGSAVSFTGYIRFANEKGCAEKLYAGIDKLQVTSMAKKDKKFLVVWRDNNEFYYDVYSYDGSVVSGDTVTIKNDGCTACMDRARGTKLGNSALSMKYKKTSDHTYRELVNDGDCFCIGYAMNGSYNPDYTDAEEILIQSTSGSGTIYTIKLVAETGKHFIY